MRFEREVHGAFRIVVLCRLRLRGQSTRTVPKRSFTIELDDAERHPDAVGVPIARTFAEVRRPDGTICDAGEVGEEFTAQRVGNALGGRRRRVVVEQHLPRGRRPRARGRPR